MKKIWILITSLPTMAFLFIVLAVAMAIATFIETGYGTPAAKVLVYNAWWFELIFVILGINLIDNIIKFRQYKGKSFTMFIFHVSFLVIVIGAAITRYISYEGTMHIREGFTNSSILSYENYLYVGSTEDAVEKEVLFSEITPKEFKGSLTIGGSKVEARSVAYIMDALRTPMASDSGDPVIDFVVSGPETQGMQSIYIKKGEHFNLGMFSAGFEAPHPVAIQMFNEGDRLMMIPVDTVTQMSMGAQDMITYNPGDTVVMEKMNIYNLGGYRFILRNFMENATFTASKSTQGRTGENAVIIRLTDGTREKIVPVFGSPGYKADTVTVDWNGHPVELAYGSKEIPIPFSLHLRDFQLERYPGSDSPSSYASEVTLIDNERNVNRDLRIYMNNTLTYRGFKFFQSSYDQDELGTILSVNHDTWGTWITYIGYFLMTLGMLLSLVNPNSHFQGLVKKLKKLSAAKVILVLVMVGAGFTASAQPGSAAHIPVVNKEIAGAFGKLWVHGPDGRIEPVGTLASDVVRKLSRKQKLYNLEPEQAILSMMINPQMWQQLPYLKVSNKTLAQQLGAQGSYVSLTQLFDEQGQYKLIESVRAAYNKAPALRNRVEKEYIYLDEKVNISFMIFRGTLITLFPNQDVTKPWMPPGANDPSLNKGDSLFVASGVEVLKQFIAEGKTSDALQVIDAIGVFQSKQAASVLPSDGRKKAEILYNRINPFERIFPWYLALGFVLLFILFINIFRQKNMNRGLKITFYSLIGFTFAIHTIGLIMRWYISGHAPWSNGYESVTYVAWASMLAGLIFGRKYPMVTGTAAFFAGISLFVAHLSWMNPEITPLVPVLKSYWLTIHVSIITASYGFIGLSAFLGILVMILFIIRNPVNGKKVTVIIEQLTSINEMSATVGLYFLSIGTFLGGIWANESWGRYWGWDPKETWSLITMLVYSFIVHMRLIPSLKGLYNYNFASILGFLSVLMTYFGVNYYLSGLHSYGRGSADGVNPAVYISFLIIAGLMFYAMLKDSAYDRYLKSQKRTGKKEDNENE